MLDHHDSLIVELVSTLQDAEQEIMDMLEDLCDEPEDDVSAHRTLATIRGVLAKVNGHAHA